MTTPEMENLIVKFFSNQASLLELEELDRWIQDSNNDIIFALLVKINYAIDYNVRTFDIDKVKKKLNQEIANERKVVKLKLIRRRLFYAAAIIVIGLMTTIYLFKDSLFDTPHPPQPTIVKTAIGPGTDKATLTLDDGSIVALEKGKAYNSQNITSNGEDIVYEAKEQHAKEIKYNYLTIPRGGQFHILLSDGTEVWLNSETQLKYPVAFIDGEPRQVELIYGEAYFDVSPSIKHEGSVFKVLNASQEIEVLGTEFNIKAYNDESNIYTTLVEGKVTIVTPTTKQILQPSEQSKLNLATQSVEVSKVDVYNEISWKDGIFSFMNMPLGEIMRVLSRWYDVDIQFDDPKIMEEKFNGALGKDQDLEDILMTIKDFGVIKDYKIENKKVDLK